MPVALIAHGGAGNWRPGSEKEAVDGMKAAVEKGRAILIAGGSALDAVCATVVALEDNPIFNAGTGAVLNFDGFCRSEEHTSELQSPDHLVCRLLLEKKKNQAARPSHSSRSTAPPPPWPRPSTAPGTDAQWVGAMPLPRRPALRRGRGQCIRCP